VSTKRSEQSNGNSPTAKGPTIRTPRPYNPGIAQMPIRTGKGRFVTPSWREVGKAYEQDLEQMTCTCGAFTKGPAAGTPCKHLMNSLLAGFFEALLRARDTDSETLERLLSLGRYHHRPDIHFALALTLWERESGNKIPHDFSFPKAAPDAEEADAWAQMDEEERKAVFA
jgi:hypothetical protein